MKPIYLGADHAGFELKEKVKIWLYKQGIKYKDLGNTILEPKDDYPDYAKKVAQAVVKNQSVGILFCGSAQGMCIAANKIKGARAVIPFSLKEARLSREHNNANIICMSGWDTNFNKATKILKIFLNTAFSREERHIRRLKKISLLEK